MSYEGYVQFLCPVGHYFKEECHGPDRRCPVESCLKLAVWENPVDETNCDAWGLIPRDQFTVVSAPVNETCNLGHQHQTQAGTYKIPSSEETRLMRCFLDPDMGMVKIFGLKSVGR